MRVINSGKHNRSDNITAAIQVPNDTAGSTRFATKPTAKCPTNIRGPPRICPHNAPPKKPPADASTSDPEARARESRCPLSAWPSTPQTPPSATPNTPEHRSRAFLHKRSQTPAASRPRTRPENPADKAAAKPYTRASSRLLRPQPRPRRARQLFHPIQFGPQLPSPLRRQPVRLLLPRRILLLEPLDPLLLEQPPQRSIQRPRAQPHPPPAHLLDILPQRVPVPRLIRQARQN